MKSIALSTRTIRMCLVSLAFCGGIVPLHGQPNRVVRRTDDTRRTALPGQLHPQAIEANERGRVDSAQTIANVTLALAPTEDQRAALDDLLVRQQTPESPDYHRWLEPAEYADRFGVSQSDVASITAWLQDQGLTVTGAARSRTWIAVSGTAGQIEAAFQTELHHYRVNGENHIANSIAPSLPQQFTGVVRAIRGLNDFHPRPFKHELVKLDASGVKPDFNSSRGSHYIAPGDLATIYNIGPLYNAGIDGTAQRLVVAGQTQINLADIQHFRSQYGLPASDPQVILVPGSRDPGIVKGDIDEAHLDLEWSGAVAPGANLVFVYAPDVFDAVQYAIDQNLAPVISTSYGSCELELSAADAVTMRGWAKQANAQGITWFSASGDAGAGDCSYINIPGNAVDIPASIPEVTAVGGTEFQEGAGQYWSTANSGSFSSAMSYIPEIAWNDSLQDGQPSSSGGGASTFFTKPLWQTGPGVPGDNARHVPDVAMSASANHDGYLVYTQGAQSAFGGTSVPTPVYAGLAALMNQYLVSRGKQSTPGLGNINPALYSLARTNPEVFHDVTQGDNIVTVTCPVHSRNCTSSTGGYSAGVGYDQVTGLGSVDAYQLVAKWTGSQPSAIAGTQLTLQSNIPSLTAADTVFLTAAARSSDGSTPSGIVMFSEGADMLGSATLAGSAGSATATLPVAGSKLSQGSGTVTATLNGMQTATIALSVTARGAAPPVPSISSIVNAASFTSSYAAGEIVSVFGSQLAPGTFLARSVPLPLAATGTAATINGIAAPLWYASPGQLNIQVPYEVAVGSPVTLVINNNGQTASATVALSAAAPAIFTDGAKALTPRNSGARGETLTLYVTGAGRVSPPIGTGAAPSPSTAISQLPAPEQNTTVTVGGVTAPVAFIGIPVGLVGVVQINFQIPSTATLGVQPVVVRTGGTSSTAATLTVTQ